MHSQIVAGVVTLINLLTVSASPTPHRREQKPQSSVRLLYQYPVGTWIENLAVRENGQILLTLLTAPQVDQLDPFQSDPTPNTVYTFPAANSVQGISELSHNVFGVSIGNFSEGFQPNAGSFSFWTVDLSESDADAHKIVDLPDLLFPDGIVSLPGTSNAVVGDIRTGRIYRVDTAAGTYQQVILNDRTAAVAVQAFGGDDYGVNGIRILGGDLYFTNTGTSFFGRLPINADGTPAGETEQVAQAAAPSATFSYDDFAISPDGEYIYFVTGGGNSVARMGIDGTPMGTIVVGDVNSTQVAGPTGCAFGRTQDDRHILYVVTSGGLASPINGDETVGAQILAVDVNSW